MFTIKHYIDPYEDYHAYAANQYSVRQRNNGGVAQVTWHPLNREVPGPVTTHVRPGQVLFVENASGQTIERLDGGSKNKE